MLDLWEHRKVNLLKVQGHWLLQMWNNNTGQFEGSGLKAQEMWFSLCWVSNVSVYGFPCWLRSGGCAGHPYWRFSIVVSPQTYTASKVCRLCLWRRWNMVLCFTTIKVNWESRLEVALQRSFSCEKVLPNLERQGFGTKCILLFNLSLVTTQSQLWMSSFVPSKASLLYGRKLPSVWLMSQF